MTSIGGFNVSIVNDSMSKVTYLGTYNADCFIPPVTGVAFVNVLIVLRADTCLLECAALFVEIEVWNRKI